MEWPRKTWRSLQMLLEKPYPFTIHHGNWKANIRIYTYLSIQDAWICVYIYIYIMYIIYIYVQTGSCSLFFRIPLFWDIRVLLSRQNVSCKHDRLHVTGIPPTFKMVKNPSMRRGLNTSWSRSPIQKAWSLEIPSLWITILPKMFPRIRVQIR